jgi:hypothetical protein
MVTCEVIDCPRTFPLKYRRRGEPQRFCSKRCRYESMYVERICPTCGQGFRTNLLSTRKDYCSLACIERSACQLCGVTITGRARFQSGERRFCTRHCANIANHTARGLKNYVVRGFAGTIQRLGHLACEHCDDTAIAHLDVHHRDHNRRNNVTLNLVTLCANCHADEHRSGSQVRARNTLVAGYLARHETF